MSVASVAELHDFQQGLRAFLEARSGHEQVRSTTATTIGYDAALWSECNHQLGLAGIKVPERYGGSGFGTREVAAVFEECGRTLVCTPLLGTMLAAEALLASGDVDAIAEHLPSLADGSTVAALVANEADASSPEVPLAATPGGGAHLLSGRKTFVIDGTSAALLIVAAASPVGASLFVVPTDAAGVTVTPLRTLDPTRRLAHLDFDQAIATPVGPPGTASRPLQRALCLGCVALAAELLGVAARVLEMSVTYACQRNQFGRPIGSFQAIKHKCADMYVAVETSRAILRFAAEAADADAAGDGIGTEARVAASLAKAWCADVALAATKQAIQIHGGVGYTWEHDAHLYFRRATANQTLLGSTVWHNELAARGMGW